MEKVSFITAFGAGMLTFFSPCILPLIPSYVSYLTGISFREYASPEEDGGRKRRIKFLTAIHSTSFIAGFTAVFVLLGTTATMIGQLLLQYQPIIKKIGGIIVVIFGLLIAGILKIPFLEKEKKFFYKKEKISVLGSLIVGATFAFGWTPCVGPILGSVLVYASTAESMKEGALLLFVFSAGLGVPFFLAGMVINTFLSYVKKLGKYIRYVTIICGITLIVFGLYLLFGGAKV